MCAALAAPTPGGLASPRAVSSGETRAAPASQIHLPSAAPQVERAWRSLRRSPEEWAAYVRGLEAAQLAALFKHNLPAELLSAFLAATDAYADGGAAHAAHALGTLRALSGAGRFAILTMCMDKADGKAAASVFAKLQAAHGRGELPGVDDLAALKAKYS